MKKIFKFFLITIFIAQDNKSSEIPPTHIAINNIQIKKKPNIERNEKITIVAEKIYLENKDNIYNQQQFIKLIKKVDPEIKNIPRSTLNIILKKKLPLIVEELKSKRRLDRSWGVNKNEIKKIAEDFFTNKNVYQKTTSEIIDIIKEKLEIKTLSNSYIFSILKQMKVIPYLNNQSSTITKTQIKKEEKLYIPPVAQNQKASGSREQFSNIIEYKKEIFLENEIESQEENEYFRPNMFEEICNEKDIDKIIQNYEQYNPEREVSEKYNEQNCQKNCEEEYFKDISQENYEEYFEKKHQKDDYFENNH